VVKTSNSNSISNLTSEVEVEAETPRISKQIDRTDALLGGFNTADATELPLHEPTGEKTRKTYDFTSMYYVLRGVIRISTQPRQKYKIFISGVFFAW
jgi:hypothetical protein